MDELKLSTQLVNGILQYLGSRPYVETANLINAIQAEAAAQGAQQAPAAPEAE